MIKLRPEEEVTLEITARVEVEGTSTAKHNEGGATSPFGGGGAMSKLRCCSGPARIGGNLCHALIIKKYIIIKHW